MKIFLYLLFAPLLGAFQTHAQTVRKARPEKRVAAPAERGIVIRNVTVVDVTAGKLVPRSTVVIAGDRIVRVGRGIKSKNGARLVDGTGKFLIPGLWDMHVHLFNNISGNNTDNKDSYFPLLLANGVTGVRDMWTDPDDITLAAEWQSEIDAGKMIGPRIFVGSRIVDGVPVIHNNSLGVSTPDEARQAVRTLKDSGAGFIKVYENLSRESYFAIADESKKRRISLAGHVPDSITPAEASNAGQKSVEHLTRMLIACSSKEDKFKNLKNAEWTPPLRAELMGSYSEQKCREVSLLFVKNGTWQVPTAVVLRGRLLSDDESFANDERLRYVPVGERQYWFKTTEKFRPADRKNREARFQKDLEILKIMHRSGVPILAGTDVGNPFIYAGFSLHDELELLVQAGLTPFESLKTATLNPAKYLGLTRTHGTIEKGKIADLVLLDADPLLDISNTKKINALVLRGRLLLRPELDAMLTSAENAAKRD